MSSSLPPNAKRQRLLRQQKQQQDTTLTLTSIPTQTLLVVASFLGPEDALALGRVGIDTREVLESCALWKEIAQNIDPVIDKIVTSLSNQVVVTDETALWRRCALSRVLAPKQRLTDVPENEPPVQYPTVLKDLGKDLPPDRYRPKQLRAYSFLLEIEKVGDGPGNRKCTVFLENIETESHLGKACCRLNFRIPDRYLDEYFPWGEDYGSNAYVYRPRGLDCRLEMTFTVYAIDRSSGKQAKIYHSGRDANLRWYWEFPNQCCGNATTNSAPYLYAYIKNPWKQGEYGGLADKSLNVFITFRNHNGSIPIIGEDMLLYLEKGHVYV